MWLTIWSYMQVSGPRAFPGFALSKIFAKNNYDIVAVARDSKKLEELKSKLSVDGCSVHTIEADLSKFDDIEKIKQVVESEKWDIETLVLNAGQGIGGDFVTQTKLDKELQLISLNANSMVHMSKIFLPKLIARGHGKIMMVSSVSGTTPIPYEAVYGATKAFVNSFFWAIRNEVKGYNIDMTLLLPGATETNFFVNAGLAETVIGSGKKDNVDEVAQRAWFALQSGHEYVYGSDLAEYEGDVLNRNQSESHKAQRHRYLSAPKRC
ncbi:hypothetical protein DASC09_040150 [Saccharomycopsis crataegensis]|uniref:Oxidoreductase n=1 Tax=Saccharomycopsis crataegensis TaxID=43959 RepID=A0AAV5QQ86_9ASCO|nr:hypothetical protein DASC09_040150 [Saccharomycopsis crataegensis]